MKDILRRSSKLTKKEEKEAYETAREFAVEVARTLDLKKCDNIDIFDLHGISVVTDFFVFGAAFARIQIQALADAVLETGKKKGVRRLSMEGYDDSGWILIDFGDVVVHLMTHETRDYYRLDRLWGDAPRLAWNTDSNEMENA